MYLRGVSMYASAVLHRTMDSVPLVHSCPVDLHRLCKAVQGQGGLLALQQEPARWQEVFVALHLDKSLASRRYLQHVTQLQQVYLDWVEPYERFKRDARLDMQQPLVCLEDGSMVRRAGPRAMRVSHAAHGDGSC